MSVATHLGIDLEEYDARIRTFIPDYEEMLGIAAAAVDPTSRVIVDLGIGTGALSARCLQTAPKAQIIGIDADAEILKAAARRLPATARFICSSFFRATLPKSDAVVASFALHHVRTRTAKARLYAGIAFALRPGGQLVSVDCQPASEKRTAERQFANWNAHLMKSYNSTEAANYLAAWAHEDVYVPLNAEMDLLRDAGFKVELLWRKDAFAVLHARRNS